MVQGITALQSDGGDEIYLEITPFWDGEDDAFDVRSADDVQLLPNLKEAILLFEYPGEQLIQAFQAFGVTLESIWCRFASRSYSLLLGIIPDFENPLLLPCFEAH